MNSSFRQIGYFLVLLFAARLTASAADQTFRWDGGGDGTQWTDPKNWNFDRLPGPTNQVVIDLPSAGEIVLTGADVTVARLTCSKSFRMQAATLRLTQGASGFASSLILTNSTIDAQSGAIVTSSGVCTAFGTALLASGGGAVILPGLLTYDGGDIFGAGVRFHADGAHSLIQLAGLTNLVGARGRFAELAILATGGGRVDLSALVSGDTGYASLTVDGVDSQLQLDTVSQVTGFAFEARNHGRLFVPLLVHAQLASFTRKDTGELELPSLESAFGTSFTARGGAVLSVPKLRTYVAGDTSVGAPRFDAVDPGSVLDFSAVTNLSGALARFASFEVGAVSGGVILLNGFKELTNGVTHFTAASSGRIQLDELQRNDGNIFAANDHGTISCSNLVEIHASTLSKQGTGILPTGQVTILETTSLYAGAGAKLVFPGVTTMNFGNESSGWNLESADADTLMDFPNLTQFHGPLGRFSGVDVRALRGGTMRLAKLITLGEGNATFRAEGAGSVLDLTHLRSLTGYELRVQNGGRVVAPEFSEASNATLTKLGSASVLDTATIQLLSRVNLSAGGGAQLIFPKVTTIDFGSESSGWNLESADAGTLMDFPNLTQFHGPTGRFSGVEVRALRGGTMRLAKLIALGEGNATFRAEGAGSVLDLIHLRSLTGYELRVQNGGRVVAPEFSEVSNATLTKVGTASVLDTATIQLLSRVNLSAGGGAQLIFPRVTTIDFGSESSGWNLESADAGTLMDFPNLTQFHGPTGRFSGVEVRALRGGTMRLAKLITLGEGSAIFRVEGAGSVLDLTHLRSLTGYEVRAQGGGQIVSPDLSELANTTLLLQGTNSVLPTTAIREVRASSFLVSDGATMAFPNLQRYAGGDQGVNARWEVAGVGSRLDFSAVTDFSGPLARFSGLSVSATRGGEVRLNHVAAFDQGSTSFYAADAGSLINLGAATKFVAPSIEVRAGARLNIPLVSEMVGGQLILRGAAEVPLSQLTRLNGVQVQVDGTTVSFPALQDAAGLNIISQNGGNVNLPPPADLRVIDISAPPAALAGAPITFIWAVTNASTNAVTGFRHDRFALRRDGVPDVNLGTVEVPNQFSGQSVAHYTATVIIPSGLIGVWRLVVTADAELEVYEGDQENNNTLVDDVPLGLSSPDLVVTSVVPAANPGLFGSSLTLTWTVHNQGTTNAPSVWRDEVVLATNPVSSVGAISLGIFERPTPLAADASYTLSRSVTLPLLANLPAGEYFLAILTDVDDSQFEANEKNNARFVPLTVDRPPLPDLTVNQIVGKALQPGLPTQVTYTVRNGSPGTPLSGSWREQVTLSSASAGISDRIIVDEWVTSSLAAAGAEIRNWSFRVPADLSPASDWRIRVVIDVDDSVVESREDNNAAFAAEAQTVAASLTLLIPQGALREDQLPPTVTARVVRNGPLDAPLTVSLTSAVPTQLSVPSQVIIPAGQQAVEWALSVIRDGLAGPDRLVGVLAAAPGYTSSTTSLTVLNADAGVLSLRFSGGSVIEGHTVAATVSHNGPTNQPVVITFGSSSPGRLMEPAPVTIPAGRSSAVVVFTALDDTLILPLLTATGRASAAGFAGAAADVTVIDNDIPVLTLFLERDTVSEGAGQGAVIGRVHRDGPTTTSLRVLLTSTNPAAATVPTAVEISVGASETSFPISAVDNLVVNGPRTTEIQAVVGYSTTGEPAGLPVSRLLTVTDDDGPTLSLKVARTLVAPGKTPATTATLRRNTATNTPLTVTLTSSDPARVALPVTATFPVGQGSIEVSVNTPAGAVPGGLRTVTVSATAVGFVSGIDTLVVSDRPLPDLVVSAVTVPTTGLSRGQATIGWQVRNQGLSTAKGSFRQTIYLSTDARLDADDLVVAEQTLDGTLPPEQSFAFARTIFLPEKPGNYYVLVRTDSNDAFVETREDNNVTLGANPVRVDVPYVAENVVPSVAIGPMGQPVQIRGRLRRTDTGLPAAFELAAVRFTNEQGVTRESGAFSELDGSFVVTFRPGMSESGTFRVAAGHPAQSELPEQTRFVLIGFAVTPLPPIQLVLVNGTTVSGSFELRAAGGVGLTGVTSAWVGLPGGLAGSGIVSNALPVGAVSRYHWTLVPSTVGPGNYNFNLRIASANGGVLEVPFQVTVRVARPSLQVTPERLLAGMVRGRQNIVRFSVTNTGAVPTGPLTLALPSAPWLASATALPVASVNPGEGREFELLLSPDAELPLQEYQGELGVLAAEATARVPFTFRHVSTAVGDLALTVEDELTYYVEGSPRVGGASVQLLDPYSSEVLKESKSDTNGASSMANVAEGPYLLRVSAPKHTTRTLRVDVRPGVSTVARALLPLETVTYSWNVEPTEIVDHYQVTLESRFETVVPFPVVTAVDPVVFPIVFPGEVTTINMTYTNHGLIAAKGLKLTPRNSEAYLITPLFTDLGDLPAKSTITVPCFVQLRPELDAQLVAGLKRAGIPTGDGGARSSGRALPAAGAGAGGGNADCKQPGVDLTYFVVCGTDGVGHGVPVDLKPLALAKSQIKCIQSLLGAKGVGSAAGAICDCTSAAVDTFNASTGGSVELPGEFKCVCAFIGLDGAGIAECLCLKISGELIGADAGSGGGFQITGVPPTGGGVGDCTQTAGASGSGRRQLGLRPKLGLDGEVIALAVPVREVYATTPTMARAPQPLVTAAGGSGICAQVVLRLEQEFALTRSAFRGTLELNNGQSTPLTAVGFHLSFFDAAGRRVDDRFGVAPPSLNGLDRFDGSGQLLGDTRGSAIFSIVPSAEAAPNGPTPYTIGGELTYTDGAQKVTVTLAPVAIQVLAQPRLLIDYYHQRDVFSDDPFTDEIEPSIPYTLAVRIRNVGLGTAKNVRITSGQPQIVENKKGLLIDFNVVGTEVFGADGVRELTPSLTADFGTIGPKENLVGRFLLKSTLQGFFLDYKATFQHLDALGNPNLSLIPPDGVKIHELTHLIRDTRPGADALPDFLVNEDPKADPDDLPDTVHLSSGEVEPVSVVRQGEVTGTLTANLRSVTVALAAGAGWTYTRIADPQGAQGLRQFQLIGVRRADGSDLPGDNFWQTDRTFIGLGRQPIHENVLHFVDFAPAGTYTLRYEPVGPLDTTPPTSSVAALPPQVVDQFPVRWTGVDAAGGSVRFDLFVSTDDGPFAVWLQDTALLGALYPGEQGHRYAFYTVATDLAGNRELAPTSPDAVTSSALGNTAPVLVSLPDQAIDEGTEFLLQPQATDLDLPPQTLTWSLAPGAPNGLVVDPTTGSLRWTTGEGNGPSTNRITVLVRDNGVPSHVVSSSFTLVIREVNQAPSLNPISDVVIKAGQSVKLRAVASDGDLPTQRLTYLLGAGSPEGAIINPVTGEFAWTPSRAQSPSTNRIVISVRDDGTPVLSASQSFTVLVRGAFIDFRLGLGGTRVRAGDAGAVPVHLATGAELNRLDLTLQSDSIALTDLRLEPLVVDVESASLQPLGDGLYRATLMAAPGRVLDGDRDVARVAFGTQPNESAYARLLPDAPLGLALDGVTQLHGLVSPGRVIVIHHRAVMEAIGGGIFQLNGEPQKHYLIETSPTIEAAVSSWSPFGTFTAGESATEVTLPDTDPHRFIRARLVP